MTASSKADDHIFDVLESPFAKESISLELILDKNRLLTGESGR